MQAWQSEACTPGAAIAIIERGQPVQARGFGVQKAGDAAPITPNTIFEAASLSKPLFACAVVRLFEQGLLDPDAPLCDLMRTALIPDEPRLAQISARRVLSHTSGLPNWRWSQDADFWQWDKPISLKFSPGERWGYSGEGFVYLQRAVEQLTGQPLQDYMQQHWLQPLGMAQTSYTWQAAFEAAFACGHDPAGKPLPKERPADANAASSLHTSVLDYARLVQWLLSPVDEPATTWRRQMLAPQFTIAPDTAWGLGVGLKRLDAGWVFWQWGDNRGFKHLVAGSPEQGVGLVILTNGESGYQVWRQVLHHTLDPQDPYFQLVEQYLAFHMRYDDRVSTQDIVYSDPLEHEVAIIGAGPIGLELAVCLKRAGVDTLHFDAHQIGYTMSWWPRNTNFFSTSERLELAGIPIQNNHQQRITGEDYLAYLRSIVEAHDLQINTYEPVTAIQPRPGGFTITTQPLAGTSQYRVRRAVIAIGDMEYPNRLNIPGEDLPHVAHYFHEPHDYFRKRLLIVGGAEFRCGGRVALLARRSARHA